MLARCGGKFSPTSLAERAQHLFISCVAAQVLSSSLICRHYMPTFVTAMLGLLGLRACILAHVQMGF